MTTGKLIVGGRRLNRRAVLGGAVGAAAAGLVGRLGAPTLVAAQDATPAAAAGGRATFVLVHGDFAGAWVWKKVVPLLRAAGHDVFATTLTGLGDRVHLASPAIDLDFHVTDVVNVLEYEDLRDITLVGHSSGGMVITGVAERVPERLAQVVYLDAVVPEDGKSNMDLAWTDEAIGSEYRAGAAAGTPGFQIVSPGVEEFIRGQTKDPADAEWLFSKFAPHPFAVASQPIKLGNPAAAALPRAFVLCTEGKGTAAEDPFVRMVEGFRSDPGWRVVEVADNHLAPVNAPQATAEALLSLV
jgi:pimeloyl-ACP methyl ester carboxylesterase